MSENPGDQDGDAGNGRRQRPVVAKSPNDALRPAAGTPPPRRSRQSRNQFVVFLNFLLSAVVILVLAAGTVFYFGKREFEGQGPTHPTGTVLIKPNTGARQIAEILEHEGFISDARIFMVGLRAYGNDDELKAGEYEIRSGASMSEIMDKLKSGKSVLYSLTVPEGLTVREVFDRIAKKEELDGEMPDALPPEGSIAADTVRFTRGTGRKEIIEKLETHQEKLVQEIWDRRAEGLPIDDIEEFVTLASIVEKETGKADERPRVAAVFLNRLEKGMRLQSDPTIIYGLFGGEGRPDDRPIYQSDLEKKTPYNTYQIDGLPPTPIANPGRAALEAVANPSRTDDLYFVADGTGGHVFSSSLEEHNQNVARWRELERKKREAAETEEAKSNKKDSIAD